MNLQLLDLTWVGIDDKGLRMIAESCSQLQVLGLSCTQISDTGIWWLTPSCIAKRITGGPEEPPSCSQLQLRQISLRSCGKISTLGVTLLAAWSSLKWIDMGGMGGLDLSLLAHVGWQEQKAQQMVRKKIPDPEHVLRMFSRHCTMVQFRRDFA